jgi:alkanesulfonate monooxygenase SsuD/methylene tetrahydromethanopterin reductase-like flavin-dependent oxidoreductase (luciferase family)
MTVTRDRIVHFGYNTPAGERGVERVNPATFVRDLHKVCDVASRCFDTFWVPDHLMRGQSFRLECWTQLTWLAARYQSQMVGTVVMANAFRHAPLLAKMAASLQEFSKGRLILGVGAGWLREEFEAYGYSFPSTKVRIAQMVEAIAAIRALWTQAPADFEGESVRVRQAYGYPQPKPTPPIMIGGDGETYLLRAVAEFADWWLAIARDLPSTRRKVDVLRSHCGAIGRNPDDILKVYPLTVYLAHSRSAAERRASEAPQSTEVPFVGDDHDLREYLSELIEIGFSHFALAFGDFPGTGDIELFHDKVLPAFR